MKFNPGRVLAGLGSKAREHYNNPRRLTQLLKSSNLVIKDNQQLTGLIEDIGILISLVRDYMKKDYTMVSKSTVMTIIAGLIYLVNPVDIIPDFMFGGFIDDAAVIGYVLNRLQGEITKYREWKSID